MWGLSQVQIPQGRFQTFLTSLLRLLLLRVQIPQGRFQTLSQGRILYADLYVQIPQGRFQTHRGDKKRRLHEWFKFHKVDFRRGEDMA